MSSRRGLPLDALVVGAGPVGLMLAAEVRRHGASCRIVDRAPAPTDKSKAVVLHARTLEHLDQLALEQEFIDRGAVVHGVSFFQGGRRLAQLHGDSPSFTSIRSTRGIRSSSTSRRALRSAYSATACGRSAARSSAKSSSSASSGTPTG